MSFPDMVRSTGKAPIHMYFEWDAVHAGHKVLMEVDDNSALIVGEPQGILGQHLKPHPIQLWSTLFVVFITYEIIY